MEAYSFQLGKSALALKGSTASKRIAGLVCESGTNADFSEQRDERYR